MGDPSARPELDRLLRVRFGHAVNWRVSGAIITLVAVGGTWGGTEALAATVAGAQLPPDVSKIDAQRYLSKRDWDHTIKFFQGVYGRKEGIIWKRIDTPPGVKALHIANTKARRRWDGINLVEADGKVTIFVLPAARSVSKRRKK